MDLRGSYLLPRDRATVWSALDDPLLLKDCLKGCEALTRADDGTYHGTVATRIGPVAARFNGKMTRSEIDEPRTCRMTFEGQGGVAGFARGTALVTLEEEAEGTRLTYAADAQIGGKLAQLGARLVEGTAKSMADDFFGRLASELGGQAASADQLDTQIEEVAASIDINPPSRENTTRMTLPLMIAAVLLAAIIYAIAA